jgi:DNA-binding transcriptional ArsR family regulator
MRGEPDIATVAKLLAEPARAQILMALDDGRALPASVLASEAGVAASTASAHLSKLLDGGLLRVEQHGRHRYYRLSGAPIGELLEQLAAIAPARPISSLREGTRAGQLRFARTCYDHLAGKLGTALMQTLLADGWLSGGDGLFRAGHDRLSAPGSAVDYRVTQAGAERFRNLGIAFETLPPRRPLIRYCVDWSEQRHHLAGSLGAAIAARMLELGWVHKAQRSRALHVSDAGFEGLRAQFGVELSPTAPH